MTAHLLLLQSFLRQFLPAIDNKRKYSHNEFSFVYTTVAAVFLRYKKIEISKTEMLYVLGKSGYSIYISNNKREVEESLNSKRQNKDYLLHIGISSASVSNLKKTLGKIAYYRNPAEISQISSLKNQISDFFLHSAK